MQFGTRWITVALAAWLSALVAGCGGGGDGGGGGTDAGKVALGVTDAPGVFLKYEVEVASVQLRKANGAEVETVPIESRIDFAQLTDLTEFLTAATVPNGRYVEATLNLDYTGADIVLDDGLTPGGVPVGGVFDTAGNPVTTMAVKVALDSHRALVVAPGVTRHLTLDFDLEASNQVDQGQSPPALTVSPVLSADLSREVPKLHRVRGPLRSVDQADRSFVLALRPFGAARDFGLFDVHTGADTIFQVDGSAPVRGKAGFALLAAKAAGTAVVAVGDFHAPDGSFLAWKVLAGSSVPGGALDMVRGVVVARAGDVLSVRGAGLDREQGSLTVDEQFTVTVGPETKVTRQLDDPGNLTAAELSVGQRVLVAGAVTGGDVDATRGQVRLLLTPVSGTLTAVPAGGPITLDLQHIAGRRLSAFDFTGTGADPSAYEVDTGDLTLSALQVGDPARALGFVTAFGTETPDFEARTLVNLAGVPAVLRAEWIPPTPLALPTVSATEIELSLEGSPRFHHVLRAGVAAELLASPPPRIVPTAQGLGVFAIRLKRAGRDPVSLFAGFRAFSAALESALAEGAAVASVSATGSFDDVTQTLTAGSVFVQLRASD